MNLPINPAIASTLPIVHTALSENSYGAALLVSQIALIFPTNAEWPLFFTTLRVVIGSMALGC